MTSKSYEKLLMEELIKILLLFGLDHNRAKQTASVFRTEIILDKNDFWVKENTVCKYLGFITQGMLRYYYINDAGDEVTRWVSLEGEFTTSLGSYIKNIKTHENIQAIKPVKLLAVHKEEWEAFCKENEYARFFWTKAIEEYLIEIESRIYSLIALNARNRYHQLIQTYPKLVKEVPDKYLSSVLGIKPRHLTRLRTERK